MPSMVPTMGDTKLAVSSTVALLAVSATPTGKRGGGLPSLGLPAWGTHEVLSLLAPAIAIGVLAFADSGITSKVLSKRTGLQFDPNQELLALGAANIGSSLLGGIAGWGFPYGEKGSVSMIVRFNYADGKSEDHPLKNGEEVADYIRRVLKKDASRVSASHRKSGEKGNRTQSARIS